MVKQIVWTHTAQAERKEILEYWIRRNKSKTFSIKLNKLFVSALKDISKNPFIGRQTDVENVRAKIIRDYLLFYEVTPNYIYVLSVWDTRRDSSNRLLK